ASGVSGRAAEAAPEKRGWRGAVQAERGRQPPGGAGDGRGPRYVQRAALHGSALAQGEEPDAGDSMRREQRRSLWQEPVSDSAGGQAGFLIGAMVTENIARQPFRGATATWRARNPQALANWLWIRLRVLGTRPGITPCGRSYAAYCVCA